MKTAIGDKAALAFAVAFYDALGAGREVEFAYKLGCSAIAMAGSQQSQVPVLLKKPQGVASDSPVEPIPLVFNGKSCPRDGVNPFNYGSPVSPEKFYGRRVALMEVKNRIGAMTPQSVNLVGLRRMGKTSFLHYIQGRSEVFFQPSQRPLIILLDLQDQRFHTPGGLLEGVRRSLTRATGREPWTVADNQDSWAVQDGLLNLRDRGDRLIVILDEFEAIGEHLEAFQGWGDDWRSV